MARVTIYVHGEMLEKSVGEAATIQQVVQDGILGNLNTAAFRLNGNPANLNTLVRDGDRLQVVPIGGKLA